MRRPGVRIPSAPPPSRLTIRTSGKALDAPLGRPADWLLDLFDRRTIFEFALLWYCIATLIMACQSTPVWLHFGRLLAGLGIGVEFVTIDTLLSELVPKERRGRTIFVGFMIAFCLRTYATTGVFLFIAGAMVIVASMVAVMGPRTARLRLEAILR